MVIFNVIFYILTLQMYLKALEAYEQHHAKKKKTDEK
jgi:hypothetical protein